MSKKPNTPKTLYAVGTFDEDLDYEFYSYSTFTTLALAKEYVDLEDAGPTDNCKWVIFAVTPILIENPTRQKVVWVNAEKL